MALRDAPRAIEAFLRAVNINPALPASWQMLKALYRMTGNQPAGRRDGRRRTSRTLASLPRRGRDRHRPVLPTASSRSPSTSIRAFLLKHGDHVEAMRLLARIGMRAATCSTMPRLLLEARAAARAGLPRRAPRLCARAAAAAQVRAGARRAREAAARLDPDNRLYRTTYANAVRRPRRHERALDAVPGAAARCAASLPNCTCRSRTR